MKCDELEDKWFNAYPEIMGIEGGEPTKCYGKADVDAAIAELKANQTWIKPSDKLPNENQEIEFIIRRKLFDDDDGVRMRVLGVYKQMFLNPPHCIFYASAPGWGSEFLPKEVEYWMPKIPMPLPSAPKEDK